MTSIFCCSNNHHCVDALKIIYNAGIEVKYILTSDKSVDASLKAISEDIGAEIVLDSIDNNLYNEKVDLLISFAYQKLIPDLLIQNADVAINFHPAPLPKYKGRANNIHAVLNGETEWGVTCHFLDESFDHGDIIDTRKFDIDNPDTITGKDLADVSWNYCLDMLENLIKRFLMRENIVGTPQKGEEKYYSMKDLIKEKEITMSDRSEIITRKINALWFPPFEGAYIIIDGVKYYLITDSILSSLA